MTQVNYVEWQSHDLARSKAFFSAAFGWQFTDYGPDYAAFAEGLDGGIETARDEPHVPLVVLKTDDLPAALDRVVAAGGEIVRPIFPFPGGRRFHFREPGGAELAVWSEV